MKQDKKDFFILLSVCLIIFGCAAGLIAKSDKYSTPEKTWETYKEAIMRGDREMALDCFAEYVKDYERDRHYDMGRKGMGRQKMIGPIKSIELAYSGVYDAHGLHVPREYKVYKIVTEKGPDDMWTIYFIKINGEWKIESLPF